MSDLSLRAACPTHLRLRRLITLIIVGAGPSGRAV